MRRRIVSLWTVTLAVAALAAVDALTAHAPARAIGARLAPVARPVTARVATAFAWARVFPRLRSLVAENLRLQDELTRAHVDQASLENARTEIDFLRQLAGLDGALRRSPREASIFTYGAGAERTVMLDRGSDADVRSGDVVITASGALVGRVEQVGDHWARVRLLEDPAMEVTARVLGTTIGGLVHTDERDGLVLDLVNKDEAIAEGQTIITSGDDRFPPGIEIGKVRSVDTGQTTLFAIVRLAATVTAPVRGPVVVITP